MADKFPSTAQRRVARPLIARNGGTHNVDLAITGEQASAGMEEVYSYENEAGERVTQYRKRRGEDETPGATLAGFGYGSGEVLVTECDVEEDHGYGVSDVQPEPGEADGEGQNMGGRNTLNERASRGPNARYTRRAGGIG